MHSPTIAEHISKGQLHGQNLIPEAKRGQRVIRDRDLVRALILEWVKNNPRRKVSAKDIGQEIDFDFGNAPEQLINYYIKTLAKAKRLTIFKELGAGPQRSYQIGAVSTPRQDGPVEITKPKAPVPRSGLDNLNAEAWAYIKGRSTGPVEDLGALVKDLAGFLAHLEAQLAPSPLPPAPTPNPKGEPREQPEPTASDQG